MKWALLTLLFFSTSALTAESDAWVTPEELTRWEKEALVEVNKHKAKAPDKEFLLYMTVGRELSSHGMDAKAQEYYLKAFEHSYKGDKSEAVIQLVNLNLENKSALKGAVERARKWFSQNPDKRTSEINRWLVMMEGHANGVTPVKDMSYHSVWAKDARVTELMKEGKAQEAYQILGARSLKQADINQRIRQDLLGALTLGKTATPPLWCKPTMEKYPKSLTWSMRICRYLDDWKSGRKSKESAQSVREQLKKENPDRLYYADLLERL